MHSVLLENGTHCIVASDLASVTWILKFMLANILPQSLYCLRS